MASKRDLKKLITSVLGKIFSDCILQLQYIKGTDKAKVEALIEKILETQGDFVTRISHPEPGNKSYYKQLRSDFNAQVDALIQESGKLN